MREDEFRKKFALRVATLFGDSEDAADVGRVSASLIELINESKAQSGSVVAALALVTAFIIDISDDKEVAFREVVSIMKKLVSFDKPAFNPDLGHDKLQ